MTKAQELMDILLEVAEAYKLNAGITPANSGVSYTLNTTNDVLTCTVTIPCTISRDETDGSLKYTAKDAFIPV